MAGRKPLEIGSLGRVEFIEVDGGVHARARTRDAGGNVRRLFKSAPNRELALELLQAQAKSLAFATEDFDQKTTLSSLLDAWIEDRSGQIKGQSIRQYRDTVRWLTPIAGALTIEELRPARIKNLLASIEATRSASAKHHARVALNGALGIAVELDIIPANPLRSMRRGPLPKATPVALNVHQVQVLRRLIVEREERAFIPGRKVPPERACCDGPQRFSSVLGCASPRCSRSGIWMSISRPARSMSRAPWSTTTSGT
jgi:hypothetical protein